MVAAYLFCVRVLGCVCVCVRMRVCVIFVKLVICFDMRLNFQLMGVPLMFLVVQDAQLDNSVAQLN